MLKGQAYTVDATSFMNFLKKSIQLESRVLAQEQVLAQVLEKKKDGNEV